MCLFRARHKTFGLISAGAAYRQNPFCVQLVCAQFPIRDPTQVLSTGENTVIEFGCNYSCKRADGYHYLQGAAGVKERIAVEIPLFCHLKSGE